MSYTYLLYVPFFRFLLVTVVINTYDNAYTTIHVNSNDMSHIVQMTIVKRQTIDQNN